MRETVFNGVRHVAFPYNEKRGEFLSHEWIKNRQSLLGNFTDVYNWVLPETLDEWNSIGGVDFINITRETVNGTVEHG